MERGVEAWVKMGKNVRRRGRMAAGARIGRMAARAGRGRGESAEAWMNRVEEEEGRDKERQVTFFSSTGVDEPKNGIKGWK